MLTAPSSSADGFLVVIRALVAVAGIVSVGPLVRLSTTPEYDETEPVILVPIVLTLAVFGWIVGVLAGTLARRTRPGATAQPPSGVMCRR